MRYYISDTHFGHEKCWSTFLREDGSPLRAFTSTEDMDQCMISRWNAVVKPEDSVYHLGDVIINRKNMWMVSQLNGRKRLVRGNHDVFKTKEYMEVGFEEIYGVFVPSKGLICSHIPLHKDSLYRWDLNIHGHLHHGRVMNGSVVDPKYFNVSVEMVDYTPRTMDWILNESKKG